MIKIILIGLIIFCITCVSAIKVIGNGDSMQPTFQDGDVNYVFRVACSQVEVGDVLYFFRDFEKKDRVLHRVVEIEKGSYTPFAMKGDNMWERSRPEWITCSMVLGRVEFIKRGNRFIRVV